MLFFIIYKSGCQKLIEILYKCLCEIRKSNLKLIHYEFVDENCWNINSKQKVNT